MSTPRQRQQIGYTRKLLKLNQDTYEDMLYSYGVKSSRELSDYQAARLLKTLRDLAKEMGVFKPVKQYAFQKYKYDNLGFRPGFATPKQMRFVEALWAEVSKFETDEERSFALNKFLKRIVNVENLRFLTRQDVEKVLKAISTMTVRRKI